MKRRNGVLKTQKWSGGWCGYSDGDLRATRAHSSKEPLLLFYSALACISDVRR